MIIHVVNYRTELDGAYGLILTSNSKEKEAVDVALGHRTRGDVGRETLGASLHYADPNILLHLTGTAGGSKINSVGRLVRHMLSTPRPRPAFVFLVGFGWGNPEKTKIGDVMIATEVVAINRRIVNGGTTFQAERPGNRLPPIAELASGLPVSRGVSSIVPGPMASLETFLADDAARDELLAQYPDVVGGEMEAYDFLHDCADIPWAVIKGVSDHGGDNPAKAKQSIAASNAASQILPLIDLLTAEGHIAALAAKSARRQNLEAAIAGEAMSISWSGDLAKLNDYLNDELQGTLLMRLQQYAGDQSGEEGMLDALAAFILELVQNSLRHGRSPSVAIDFHETKLVVSDQSPPFALDGLRASEKGGGEAWICNVAYVPGPQTLVLDLAAMRVLQMRQLTLRHVEGRRAPHDINISNNRPKLCDRERICAVSGDEIWSRKRKVAGRQSIKLVREGGCLRSIGHAAFRVRPTILTSFDQSANNRAQFQPITFRNRNLYKFLTIL